MIPWLAAPNAHGEMTMYTIVDPTWELNIPGAPHDKINVMGNANKVINYINTQFPDYVWPHVDGLNTMAPEKVAQDDPKPNCNVFTLAPLPMANACQTVLKQIGSHLFNLGSGPGTCAQVECREDLQGRRAAIWWCNDVSESRAVFRVYVQFAFTRPDTKDSCPEKQDLTGASVTANDIADLAGDIIPTCVEFGTPMSWTRGQIFHATEPWNVIVTGYEKCR